MGESRRRFSCMPLRRLWPSLHAHKTLVLILAASCVVRAVLIIRGGQFYWPDEREYSRSRQAVEYIVAGQYRTAVESLLAPDHLLFAVLGLFPAALEQAVGATSRIPALFFSLFSVAGIWAVWRVARLLGSNDDEACFAALLIASASTWSYYSRHLLPYDAAMGIGLMALVVSLRDPKSTRDSWWCGVLCAAAFLTYAGYWTLSALVVVLRVVRGRRGASDMLPHGARVLAGSALLPVIILGAAAVFGRGLALETASFARTVTQGQFSEGWSLPLAYLWHAEHLLAVLWLLAVIVATFAAISRAGGSRVALASVLFVYGALVLASAGLHVFVVYGRLARQLVPFLCLVTAQQIYRLRATHQMSAKAITALGVGVVAQGAWNLSPPMSQVFPDTFRERAVAITNGFDAHQTEILYADHIYPTPQPIPNRKHRELARARHPLQYLP